MDIVPLSAVPFMESPTQQSGNQQDPKPQTPVESQNVSQEKSSSTLPPPHSKKGIPFPLGIALILLFIGGLFPSVWYFQSQLKTSIKPTALKPTPVTAVAPKKLVFGTDPTLPPMEFLEKGTMAGYDIDLGNFIGKELGAQVEYKNIIFDDLFKALENKEVDMIISAVTITDERKQKYDFSEPYLNAGQVIITKIGDNSIKTTADLRGKRIATQKGTTNETEALKYTDKNLVIITADFVQATNTLVTGKADALFTDLPNAKGVITANPTLKISSDPFTNEYYGIVFRKGDPTAAQINEAIASLRVKGIITDLKQKWLD